MIGEVEIHSAPEIDAALRETLEAWFKEQFGHVQYHWADPDWYVVVSCDGKPAGRAGIFERTISIDGIAVQVGGIGGVATRSEWRNRGVASRAMRSAADFIARKLHAPFGLLLCRPAVAPVNAKLGWEKVEGPTTFAQAGGLVTYPDLTMALECGDARWPAGPINLCGLPW